ncbi:MAG: prepilin-type N-terminal cleavage/methylation domain-containing protein [Verrucomicrobiia bacterium]|tara:strand:- start:20055 stop:20513 length:459 start_codon:yes stop_codon:yes gene_type:complete
MRNRAFTIIEVLAALAIFATAAIVLGAAYVNVLNGYAHAERATKVDADLRFAREILFRQPDLDLVEEGDEFESADGRRVIWRAIVEPTLVADLFEVEFEVELIDENTGEGETVTERFRLLRPTWSEDNDRDQLRQEARDNLTQYLEGYRGNR